MSVRKEHEDTAKCRGTVPYITVEYAVQTCGSGRSVVWKSNKVLTKERVAKARKHHAVSNEHSKALPL